MCGIAGYITKKTEKNYAENILHNMIKTLNHRGPNSNDIKIIQKDDYQVAFAHSRLSIIDVSNSANQPMSYKNLNIVFNGEIYNYKEIKQELLNLGHNFSTNSDTEVILHSFEQWNLKCVDKFIGMFAFAIHDQNINKIYFFRDRVGVKPFYYYKNDNSFIFGSELKTLIKHPEFNQNIDINSSGQFFKYGYIHAPNTIYKNTFMLLPGNYIDYDINKNSFETKEYWNVTKYYNQPKKIISFEDAKQELEQLLISSCNYRMVADVPVGIFLSGGYDSSLVTGILTNQNYSNKIKTFTIGFEDKNFNEASHARKVSDHLKTQHNELYCTEQDAINIFPELPFYYDEPFFDISSIPSILLSRFTKNQVTVALSADGGDEIFGGYDIYKRAYNYNQKLNKIPNFTRSILSEGLNIASKFVPKDRFRILHNIQAISKYNKANNKFAFLLDTMSQKMNFSSVQNLFNQDVKDNITVFDKSINGSLINFQSDLDQMTLTDYLTYLPNNILTKVDRATMSSSLEGREPLLDHRIIEYCANLPDNFKFDGTIQKKILKSITHKYVPAEIMERPKMGFVFPVTNWLRNQLKSYLLETLSKKNIDNVGFLNTEYILKARDFTLKNPNNNQYFDVVYSALQYVSWYNYWI